MILSIKKITLIILFLMLCNKVFFATVVVNAPSCNQSIEHKCDETGNCTTNTICAFPPVNIGKSADAIIDENVGPNGPPRFLAGNSQEIIAVPRPVMPPIVFLKLQPDVITKELGIINAAQETLIKVVPRTEQTVISYTPTVGIYAGKKISFLFYMINLAEKTVVETAPLYIKNQIQKHMEQHPESQYVFVIAKSLDNVARWSVINQTYITDFSTKEKQIQVSVQPDGNISLLIPTIFNEAANKIDKPQLFSIDIGKN